MYRATPRLQVGIEGNLAAEEAGPLLNWVALAETEHTPMLTLGTSSDRIFSPKGNQAYYATAAKGVHGTPFAPYVGVSWSEWEERLLFPAGVNVALSPAWDFMQMYDGRNCHALLTHKTPSVSWTVMLVKMKHVGLSAGVGF